MPVSPHLPSEARTGEADALSYYAGQSRVTDPGRRSGRLADLPGDVGALQRAARGLVIHYRSDELSAHGISEERWPEVDSRYAETMLGRLVERDGRPLTEHRPPDKRLLGCCRDFTVLFLTMARHRGIPARARVGFATYFDPGFSIDHEVAEVWDAQERRWRLVDAELGDDHVDPTDGMPVDPLDVSRDRFLVAGAAWEACRGGDASPDEFLVHPDLDVAMTRGWPYLRHNVVHDLAALNKVEMLLWDYWGLMEVERPSEGDLVLLDRVARATLTGEAPAEVQTLYADDARLRVPRTVTSYSPAAPEPRTVVVET